MPSDRLEIDTADHRARPRQTIGHAAGEIESRVGYEILSKKASPSIKWLQTARQDLATEYEALHQPEQAAKFRELAAKTP